MTISEKILFEKDRHIKKIDELVASLEMECKLHKKNMDELIEEEIEKKHQQLTEGLKKFETMERNGIILRTGSSESSGAALETLVGDTPIIKPEYDQEKFKKQFDSESNGKVR